jgi:hypothetical protein
VGCGALSAALSMVSGETSYSPKPCTEICLKQWRMIPDDSCLHIRRCIKKRKDAFKNMCTANNITRYLSDVIPFGIHKRDLRILTTYLEITEFLGSFPIEEFRLLGYKNPVRTSQETY